MFEFKTLTFHQECNSFSQYESHKKIHNTMAKEIEKHLNSGWILVDKINNSIQRDPNTSYSTTIIILKKVNKTISSS